jgi:hypothetical protein
MALGAWPCPRMRQFVNRFSAGEIDNYPCARMVIDTSLMVICG